MTDFYYPYPSTIAKEVIEAKRSNRDIDEWWKPGVDFQKLVAHLSGSILEIGGPTDVGYYFLDNIQLPSRVIISNITQGTLRFTPNKDELDKATEKLIDGRDLPYSDNSLGMVLSAHISLVDDHEHDFSDISDDQLATLNQQIKRSEIATRRMAQMGKIDPETLEVAQRVAIGHEVFAKLQPGGLYITDATPDELKAYHILGFTEIAHIDTHSIDPSTQDVEPYYYVVLQK